MANPFDQFDAPASKTTANPFDNFDNKPVTVGDRVRATAAGVNRGFYADLLGLPVDTAANILDLGKAAFGTAATALGRPDLAPAITDRSNVVGSSDWIARKANDIGLGSAVNNPNPQDAMSRVLHTGGRFAGASVVPVKGVTAADQVSNMAKGAVGGIAAGSTAEVAPEWAGVAGMLPTAAGSAVSAASRMAGVDAARKAMQNRIQTLKEGGIDNPSLGLATGNSFISGLENLLSQTPGSVGLFDRARAANVAGMQSKAEDIRNAISSDYGPVVAGEAIQNDLKVKFPQRISDTAKALANRVSDLVGGNRVVPVDNTMATADRLSSPIPGAEATSSEFINPRIAKLSANLRDDVYGAAPNPAGSPNYNPTLNPALTPEVPQVTVNNSSLLNIPIAPNTPLPQAEMPIRARSPVEMDSLTNLPKPMVVDAMPQRGGPNPTLNLPLSTPVPQQPVANPDLWNIPVVPNIPLPQRPNVGMQDSRAPLFSSLMNTQKEQGIPFSALKSLRTSIGDESVSNAIMGTPEQAQFKQLYGAMSQDMRQAVNDADRANAGVPVGPLPLDQQPAAIALNRANQQYSTAMNRAEALNGIANRDTPEGAYKAVASSLGSGPTVYERLRSAVTPETRQKVAATVVDEMGRATPGTQNAAGDVWSPRTFLTNYNKLYQNEGGPALFTRLPGGATYADNLAKIAKTADMLSDGAKVWSNPSGTSQALIARGTIGTIAAGAAGGIFYSPLIAPAAVAAGSLGLAHQVSQRLLLNPKFVNWLAKAPVSPTPEQSAAHAQRLMMTAKITSDPQFQQDAKDYLDAVGK